MTRDQRRREHALTLWREKRAQELDAMRERAARQLEIDRTKLEARKAFAAECETQTPEQRRALLAQLAAKAREQKASDDK